MRREGRREERGRREGEDEAEREGPVRGQYMWDRFTCKSDGVSDYVTFCLNFFFVLGKYPHTYI